MDMVTHRGGCHCGAVRFEVRAPARVTVQGRNCPICAKTAFLHLIVPRSNPDGWSVNLRCLDAGTVAHATIEDFDGQNRERHGATLTHLSAGSRA